MSNGTSSSNSTPYTLTTNSALMDDYIYTADVLVSQNSPAPIAVFTLNGQSQALFINANEALCQIVPSPGQTAAGWSVSEVGTTTNVDVVAAGQQNDGTTHGFYADSSNLYHIALGAGGWSTPDTLPLASFIRVANNVATGELLAYGVDANGDLLIASETTDGTWTTTTITVPSTSLDGTTPMVLFTDTQNDWIMAVQANLSSGGQLDVYQGSMSGTVNGPSTVPITTGAVDQILVSYWNDNAAMFLFNDVNGNLYWTVGGSGTANQIPNATVTSGGAIVDYDNMLHCYMVNSNSTGLLSVLHQTGWSDGAPQWAPIIPLNSGFVSVATDINPFDAVSFFAVDVDGALWFLTQDQTTGQWWSGKAQMPGDQAVAYNVSQYRTLCTFTDAQNNPVPGLNVSITASTTSAILVSGVFYTVSSSTAASLTTDASGTLTISQIGSSLSAPQLTFSASGLASSVTFDPSSGIHMYLSGIGTLNPGAANSLPQFGTSTLQSATVNNAPLAPAVTNNGNLATSAVQGISGSFATSSQTAGPDMAGWALDLSDPENPRFMTFATREDLESYRQTVVPGSTSGFLEFLDDIWEGIKNAVITVTSWVVDVVKKTVSLVTDLGSFVGLLLTGIEDVVAVVQSIFALIGAAIDDLLDWLAMQFNWQAIWNTATAFSAALAQAFPYIQGVISQYASSIGSSYFQDLETQITQTFDAAIAQLGGKIGSLEPSQSSLPSWVSEVTSMLSLAQNNWLLDKIAAYFGDGPSFAANTQLSDAWTTLTSTLTTAFTTAIADLVELFGDFLTDLATAAGGIMDVAPALVLELSKLIILRVLSVLDTIVQDVLTFAAAAAGAAGDLLSAPFELPFLLGIFQDILQDLGVTATPTIADLFCLALAIPITLTYTAIYGSEPFPGGTLPQTAAAPGTGNPPLIQWCQCALIIAWGFFNAALDTNPSKAPSTWLCYADVIVPILIVVFLWPGGVPFGPIPTGTALDAANNANWLVGLAPPILDAGWMLAANCLPIPATTISRYNDPYGKWLDTLVGSVNLVTGVNTIVQNVNGGGSWYSPGYLANITGPLPAFLQVLMLDRLVTSTDGGSQAVKIVVDVGIGGVMTGLLCLTA